LASAHYNTALEQYTKKQLDLVNDALKVRLVRTSAYTFSQSHTQLSDLPAAIVTDVTLGSKSVVGGTLDAADAAFIAVTAGAAIDALVIYDDTTATKYLLAYIDGFTVTPNGGDITIQWANSTPFIFKI
jgi:Ethanolamine utilization protein EutJ (predicted chaperonin)